MNPFLFLTSASSKNNNKSSGSPSYGNRPIINLRLRFSRNLLKYPFPSSLGRHPDKVAYKVWQELSDFLTQEEVFRRGDGFYKFYLPDLKKREKIFLVERRVISPDMLKSSIPAGVIFTKDEKFVALINEEDHLRISVNDASCPIQQGLSETLEDIVRRMDERLVFARDEIYGYLTSCPSNLGKGIRVSALFHLGGLALSGRDKINTILDSVEKKGFYIRGYYGEKSRYYGDVFQVSTIRSPSDDEGFEMVYDFFLELEKKEMKAREEIVNEKRSQDIIWRSWGVLNTARMISFAEASSALSMISLGIDIGLDIPAKKDTVEHLIKTVQPAHIEMLAGVQEQKMMNAQERDIFRADYIRKILAEQ